MRDLQHLQIRDKTALMPLSEYDIIVLPSGCCQLWHCGIGKNEKKIKSGVLWACFDPWLKSKERIYKIQVINFRACNISPAQLAEQVWRIFCKAFHWNLPAEHAIFATVAALSKALPRDFQSYPSVYLYPLQVRNPSQTAFFRLCCILQSLMVLILIFTFLKMMSLDPVATRMVS